jgi:hypothetical protein
VQVLLNKLDWASARIGIASDWTQYISAAKMLLNTPESEIFAGCLYGLFASA